MQMAGLLSAETAATTEVNYFRHDAHSRRHPGSYHGFDAVGPPAATIAVGRQFAWHWAARCPRSAKWHSATGCVSTWRRRAIGRFTWPIVVRQIVRLAATTAEHAAAAGQVVVIVVGYSVRAKAD